MLLNPGVRPVLTINLAGVVGRAATRAQLTHTRVNQLQIKQVS